MGANRHAVFFAHPREAIAFHYERDADDPRVTHEFTLEVDEYGNVMRSVSVGYPRRAGYAPPEPTLSADDAGDAGLRPDAAARRGDRASIHQRHRRSRHAPDAYRTPLPCASNVAEITGIAPRPRAPASPTCSPSTTMDDADLAERLDGTHDIPYEAIPAADVDGAGAPAARRRAESSPRAARSIAATI